MSKFNINDKIKSFFSTHNPYTLILSAIALFPIKSILDYFVYQNYSIKAQEFYNIPKKYFLQNSNHALFTIALGLLLLLIIFSPVLLRDFLFKENEKQKIDIAGNIFLLFAISFFLFLISLSSFVQLLPDITEKQNSFLFLHHILSKYTVLYTILLFLSSCFTIFDIYFINQIKKMMRAVFFIFFCLIFIFSIFFSLMPFLVFFCNCVTQNPAQKQQYETYIASDNTDMVILSSVNDKILVVPYTKDNHSTIFYTKKYMLIDPININMTYTKFEIIIINKDEVLE